MNTLINLIVAISAPVMAFISADVLALELMAGDYKHRRAIAVYDEQVQQWNDGLMRSWAARQGRWGVKIEVEKSPELPDGKKNHDGNSGNSGNSGDYPESPRVSKPSPKLSLAMEWLKSHPDKFEMDSRALGELIGVSHGTVNKARSIINQDKGV